jgi:ribosomal protein S7
MKNLNFNNIKKSKKKINSLQFNIYKKKINKFYKKITRYSLNFIKKKYSFIYIKHNIIFTLYIKKLKLKYLYKVKKFNLKKLYLKLNRQKFNFYKKFNLTTNILKQTNFKFISNLYEKFLSFIFKIGKKNIWNDNFSYIFDLLSLKLYYSKSVLLLKIFTRLFTRVEVKKVKSRKRITYIPFFIKLSRSIFLSLKWIFLAIIKKKNNISIKNKLFNELLLLLTQKSCFSLQKLNENNNLAFKNRSNIHYRWQGTR